MTTTQTRAAELQQQAQAYAKALREEEAAVKQARAADTHAENARARTTEARKLLEKCVGQNIHTRVFQVGTEDPGKIAVVTVEYRTAGDVRVGLQPIEPTE